MEFWRDFHFEKKTAGRNRELEERKLKKEMDGRAMHFKTRDYIFTFHEQTRREKKSERWREKES